MKKLAAIILSLVMVFSLFAESVSAIDAIIGGTAGGDFPMPLAAGEEYTPKPGEMHFIISHWHADGTSERAMGYIDKDGNITMDADSYVSAGGMNKDGTTITIKDRSKSDSDGKAVETLSGYAISAGQNAVTVGEDKTVKIEYNENIPLVKVHVFYSPVLERVSAGPLVKGDVTTEHDVDASGTTKIYNNTVGLHTDKTVVAIDADGNVSDTNIDARTFEVTLEAWYTNNSLADVGLILDASGSMAFISDITKDKTTGEYNIEPIKLPVSGGKVTLPNGETINTYEYIELENLNSILDPTKTDNSKLGFSDYAYYVFNEVQGTSTSLGTYEFTPLGYWDGTSDVFTYNTAPALESLIGHYSFEGNLSNNAYELGSTNANVRSGAAASLVQHPNGDVSDYKTAAAAGTTAAFTTTSGNYYSGNSALNLNATAESGKTSKDAQDNGHNSAILLDVAPSSTSFTLSFAVKLDTWEDGSTQTSALASLFYVGSVNNPSDNSGYKIFRGTGKGGAVTNNNHLRINSSYTLTDTASIPATFQNVFNNTNYHFITIVFDTTTDGGDPVYSFRLYVDGSGESKKDEYTILNNNLGFDPNRFDFNDIGIVLGAFWDNAYDGYSLYLDELFVYDKALNDTEVADLFAFVQNPYTLTSSTNFALAPDGTTMADLKNPDLKNGAYDANAAGWYYVNPGSTLDDKILDDALASSKELVGVMTNEIIADVIIWDKLPQGIREYFGDKYDGITTITNGNSGKYIYTGLNGDNADFTYTRGDAYYSQPAPITGGSVDGKGGTWNSGEINSSNQAISLPSGITSRPNVSGASANIFYFDSQGFLRCVYKPNGTSSNSSANTHISYVYEKRDDTRIKYEVLQYALGSFVAQLHSASPDSRISAVRFSHKSFNEYGDSGSTAYRDRLVLLDWTKDPYEASKMLSFDYGDAATAYKKSTVSEANETKRQEDGINQYNYVMTGGTYMYTGLDAYKELLDTRIKRDDPNHQKAKKYLIVFTDGKDNFIFNESDRKTGYDTAAKNTAQSLKEKDYTIFVVMLTGGAFKVDDNVKAFIGAVAGNSETDETYNVDNVGTNLATVYDNLKADKLIFEVSSLEDLTETFTHEILGQISDTLNSYTVEDYIDPRFDIYDDDGNLLVLGHGGIVNDITDVTADDYDDDPIMINGASLRYDEFEDMYYLRWDDTSIPGSTIGDSTLAIWTKSFKLEAKEDFIGGNAILTNGNAVHENYVHHNDSGADYESGIDNSILGEGNTQGRDQYVSKGFPRTTVNVALLEMNEVTLEQTLYLGETVSEEEFAKALGDLINSEEQENIDYYWEYLTRFYTYYSEDKISAMDGNLPTTFNDALIELITSGSLTLPYSYLPNADDQTNTTGTDKHIADIIGTLTYKWTPDSDNQKLGPNNETTELSPLKYTLHVEFEPTAVDDSTITDDRTNSTNGLISEEIYQWEPDFKEVAGGEQEDTDNQKNPDIHTTDIVGGEIVFGLQISVADYEFLCARFSTETVSYTAKLVKGSETVGTFTAAIPLDGSLVPVDGYVTVYAQLEKLDTSAAYSTILAMGDYTIVPAEDNTTNLPINFSNITIGSVEDAADNGKFVQSDASVDLEAPTVSAYAAASGLTFMLGNKNTYSADYLNHRFGVALVTVSTGNLIISKDVTVAGEDPTEAEDLNKEFTFIVEFDGAAASFDYIKIGRDGSTSELKSTDGTVKLKHGESASITVPIGTAVTVTESDYEGYTPNQEVYTDTITDGKLSMAAFVNAKILPGSLTITKTVEADADVPDQEFTFTVELSGTEGTVFNYKGSKTGTIKSGETITLKHGESITILDIPDGTKYTVTETDIPENYTLVSSTGTTGTIGEEAVASAEFVNKYTPPESPVLPPDEPPTDPESPDEPDPEPPVTPDPEPPVTPDTPTPVLWGDLTIRKTVEGDDAEYDREFTFTVELKDASGSPLSGWYYYDGSKTGILQSGGSITLKHGEQIVIRNLPVGSNYSITEDVPEDYIVTSVGANGQVHPYSLSTADFVNHKVIVVDMPVEAGDTETEPEPEQVDESDDANAAAEADEPNDDSSEENPKTLNLFDPLAALMSVTVLAAAIRRK